MEIEIELSCTVLQYHFEPQDGAVGQCSVPIPAWNI